MHRALTWIRQEADAQALEAIDGNRDVVDLTDALFKLEAKADDAIPEREEG